MQIFECVLGHFITTVAGTKEGDVSHRISFILDHSLALCSLL